MLSVGGWVCERVEVRTVAADSISAVTVLAQYAIGCAGGRVMVASCYRSRGRAYMVRSTIYTEAVYFAIAPIKFKATDHFQMLVDDQMSATCTRPLVGCDLPAIMYKTSACV